MHTREEFESVFGKSTDAEYAAYVAYATRLQETNQKVAEKSAQEIKQFGLLEAALRLFRGPKNG